MSEENKERVEDFLPEGVTLEQWEKWKALWKVKILQLPRDDNGSDHFNVIAKVPDRGTISEYEKWSDRNPDKAKDILITNCLLTGVEVVKADLGLFLTCYTAIAELIPIRKAIIKNF